MTKVGDKKVKICKVTGKKVLMIFDGVENSGNGCPGWVCLHEEKEFTRKRKTKVE